MHSLLQSHIALRTACTTAQRALVKHRSFAALAHKRTIAAMASEADDVFHMGPGTLRISRKKLHGNIRSKLVEMMQKALPEEQRGIILLKGGDGFHLYTTDTEMVFRQEAYFHYLFGANEEGFFGALDARSGRSLLFIPKLPDSYAVWMGEIKKPAYYAAKYAVDEVHYVEDMARVLGALAPPCLHLLSGTNTDSGTQVPGATFDGINSFSQEVATLFDVINECRVHKGPEEVAVMRYANKIAAAAHVEMMRAARPDMMEYQLEAAFMASCYSKGGARNAAYTPILASGPNGAVLHYGHAGAPNDRQMRGSELVLCDCGCEYYRYASDITATWPVGGRFSEDQKIVYNAVLAAHTAVISAMRPGVSWPDMHLLANRTILGHLKAGGLLVGEVEEMMEVWLGALFMPHGLGHFLGIDTHDVGGYGKGFPERIMQPGIRSLRTARLLEPGMVITVEPGCYFNPALLLPAFEDPAHAKFLVKDRLLPFLAMGGVRLEDNVLVTEQGAESLTSVPRTVEEVEAVMAGAAWKGL